ncbi:16012_t:CDS:2 [Funneliformis geosporum]|uniref:16012_t:CDS:1 n=1 Tax=Funneliformis geosporum TaxID=1117311 RepID=A0A9W4SLN4_9GLOM|nr:16012_t:CDS:2 [Funneliformis geosporum]
MVEKYPLFKSSELANSILLPHPDGPTNAANCAYAKIRPDDMAPKNTTIKVDRQTYDLT